MKGALTNQNTISRLHHAKLSLLRFFCRQEWLRYGKGRLLCLAFDRKNGVAFCFREPFFGFSYDGQLNDFIDQEVFFYGFYAAAELGYIETALRFCFVERGKRPVLYDVGANIGHHTLFAASCGARVVAFEPAEKARRALVQKKTLNTLSDVTIVPLGLGETRKRAELFVPQGTNIGSASLFKNHEGLKETEVEIVEIETGNDLVEKNNFPAPDFIKVDVEGYERSALVGLRRTLRKNRPFILMELSETSRNFFNDEQTLRNTLPDCYKLYTLSGSRYKLFYSLRSFCFYRTHDVVAIPAERSGAFFEAASTSWLRGVVY